MKSTTSSKSSMAEIGSVIALVLFVSFLFLVKWMIDKEFDDREKMGMLHQTPATIGDDGSIWQVHTNIPINSNLFNVVIKATNRKDMYVRGISGKPLTIGSKVAITSIDFASGAASPQQRFYLISEK